MANAKHERHTYYSLEDFAEVAKAQLATDVGRNMSRSHDDSWSGGSDEQAFDWIRNGWPEGLEEAMPIVEAALATIEQEFDFPTFNSYMDVTGCEVDVARFLSGVPENMIEYEPTIISKVGKVVTLCASTVYSGGVSVEQCLRRGAAITALAMALEKCGHETELWADFTCTEVFGSNNDYKASTRVLVKGAHDVVDPSRIAYAYANPTFLRRLLFLEWLTMNPTVKNKLGIPGMYGNSAEPDQDLPEGTIYLPTLHLSRDQADSGPKMVMDTLRKLGLVKE